MSAEEVAGLRGNGMLDPQMVYAGSFRISATALEAMTKQQDIAMGAASLEKAF